jgi:hypothetical protein
MMFIGSLTVACELLTERVPRSTIIPRESLGGCFLYGRSGCRLGDDRRL